MVASTLKGYRYLNKSAAFDCMFVFKYVWPFYGYQALKSWWGFFAESPFIHRKLGTNKIDCRQKISKKLCLFTFSSDYIS